MPKPFPAGYLALAAVAAALVCTPLSGCDDTVAGKRRGGEGESCTSTDDCQSSLKCFANVCLAEPAAGGASPCSCTGAGGTGAGQCTCSGCGGSAAAGGSGGTGGSSTSSSGGGTGGTTSGTGGTGGTGGSAGCPVFTTSIGPGDSVSGCDDCLDTLCAAELLACGGECYNIEACIETVARALSDPAEESACFVYCQNNYLAGKQPHLDVAWCAYYSGSCFPPCYGYSTNYSACRAYMQSGPCAPCWAACQNDIDCQLYMACTSACTTCSECLSCSSTAAGLAGRQLYEAYERCIASECIAESWM